MSSGCPAKRTDQWQHDFLMSHWSEYSDDKRSRTFVSRVQGLQLPRREDETARSENLWDASYPDSCGQIILGLVRNSSRNGEKSVNNDTVTYPTSCLSPCRDILFNQSVPKISAETLGHVKTHAIWHSRFAYLSLFGFDSICTWSISTSETVSLQFSPKDPFVLRSFATIDWFEREKKKKKKLPVLS